MRCQRALTWVRHRVLATDMIGRLHFWPGCHASYLHATANHLRGHRPEANPTDCERHQPSEGKQHLAFRIGGLATNPAPGISSQHSPPQTLPQMVAHPQGIGDGRE